MKLSTVVILDSEMVFFVPVKVGGRISFNLEYPIVEKMKGGTTYMEVRTLAVTILCFQVRLMIFNLIEPKLLLLSSIYSVPCIVFKVSCFSREYICT